MTDQDLEVDQVQSRLVLYELLNKCMVSGDDKKVIELADRLLEVTPNDELAFRCKMGSCVNLGRFVAALDFARTNPTLTENDDVAYDLAYCHYRLDQMEEAMSMLDKIQDAHHVQKKKLYVKILNRLKRFNKS